MNVSFDVDKDMQPNIIEVLPLVTKNGLDFEALEKMTSKEFVDEIRKEYNQGKDLSAFTCEVKKVIRSHRGEDYADTIYVLIGHFIYSHIYSYCTNFPRKYNWEQDRLILNHNYYMEVIQPFMEQVDKKLIWKKRK